MSTQRTSLGAAIRRLRQARSLTLADVAYAAGTDPANISRLERGQQGYSDVLLAAVADELGVPLWELFKEAADGPQFREERGRSTPSATKSSLTQRYTQASPAVRKLVDSLLNLAASGKLSDETSRGLIGLLPTLPRGKAKTAKSKKR